MRDQAPLATKDIEAAGSEREGSVASAATSADDATGATAAEGSLSQSETSYRFLFEANPVPMWVFERGTLRFLAVNEAAVRQYGFSREEFLTMTIVDIRPPEDVPRLLAATAAPIHGLQKTELWRHRKKDGTVIDVEIVCHDMNFRGLAAELVAAFDVTKRMRSEEALRQAEEKYRSIFEDAVIGIIQGTPEGRPIKVNRAFAMFHGYSTPQELIAAVWDAGEQVFVDSEQWERIKQTLSEGGTVSGAEVQVYRKDGSTAWASLNMRAVRDANGAIVLHEGTVEDITDRKLAQERVKFLAYHDSLTGLPNHVLLKDRLTKALAAARRRRHKLAILFLDIDRFKLINDFLGHSCGDLLLQRVAERLKACAREEDTLARVGGDEFLIVLANVADLNEATSAARRVMDSISAEFVIQGHSLNLTCSIGISISPDHGSDGETLIKNADAAMYYAKDHGRNASHIFTVEMNAQLVERLTMEHALRYALQRNQLFLMYQPQFELASGRITGFEALLRWKHPQLGLISPDRFIPVAETTGLIVPIGEWVLRTACSQANRWQEQGLPALPVAVNVSAVQLQQNGIVDLIKATLRKSRLDPRYLELELTESGLFSNPSVTPAILRDLKKMGLKLAIDDFGTGYSSLSYLRHFPIDKIKIDRSFIWDVANDTHNAALTAAIISMSKALHLTSVAEGVENDAQMSFLRAHGCDQIQGYLLAPPLAVTEATDLLRECVISPVTARLSSSPNEHSC